MFEITREIGIDAGHRVMNHVGKCKNLHGHRYTIQATISGEVIKDGSGEGMVTDFSILKEIMMQHIDAPCDHGMIVSIKDKPLLEVLRTQDDEELQTYSTPSHIIVKNLEDFNCHSEVGPFGKLYVIVDIPTAENLARHWFERMAPIVVLRSNSNAKLVKVRVWETPNSFADYCGV